MRQAARLFFPILLTAISAPSPCQLGRALYRLGGGINDEPSVSGDLKTILSTAERSNRPMSVVSKAPLFDPLYVNYVPKVTNQVLAPGGDAILDIWTPDGDNYFLERRSLQGILVWRRPVPTYGGLVAAAEGDRVVLATGGNTYCFRASTGALVSTLNVFTNWTLSDLSADGRYFVQRSNPDLRVWDVESASVIWQIQEEIPLKSADLSADGRYIAWVTVDAINNWLTLSIVDIPNNVVFPKRISGARAYTALSPDGRFYTGTSGNKAAIRESATGNLVATLSGTNDYYSRWFWSTDGKSLLGLDHRSSGSRLAYLHDVAGAQGTLISRSAEPFTDTDASGSFMLTTSNAGVDRMKLATGETIMSYQTGIANAFTAAYFGAVGQVCTIHRDADGRYVVRALSQANGTALSEWRLGEGVTVGMPLVSRPGTPDFAASTDTIEKRWARAFDVQGQAYHPLGPFSPGLNILASSGDGRWLVVGNQTEIRVLDRQGTLGERRSKGNFGQRSALSRDGQWLASVYAGTPCRLVVRRAQDMTVVSEKDFESSVLFARPSWSADGNYLWCLLDEALPFQTFAAIDWRTGMTLIREPQNPEISTEIVTSSADGQYLTMRDTRGWVSLFRSPLAPDRSQMPTSYEVPRGTWIAGTVASAYYFDADWLTVRTDLHNGPDKSAGKIVLTAQLTPRSELKEIETKFSLSRTGEQVTLQAYDWVQGHYVTLAQVPVTLGWNTWRTTVPTGSRFVRKGDGTVRCVLSIAHSSVAGASLVSVDRMRFSTH